MIYKVKLRCRIKYLSYEDVIPIVSCSIRLRSGDPSYFQAVIRDMDYLSTVNFYMAYVNADKDVSVYIEKKINGGAWMTIGDYLYLETSRHDKGATNQSITITGHRTWTFSGTTRYPSAYSYVSKSGETVVRTHITETIEPDDRLIITAEGVDIDPVDLVSINCSVGTYTLEARG